MTSIASKKAILLLTFPFSACTISNTSRREVREVGTNTVVTVIEILSPKNKRKGKGRTAYENKRQRVLGSLSHLVEIDLLRGNLPMPMTGEGKKMDYLRSCTIINKVRETGFLNEKVRVSALPIRAYSRFLMVVQDLSYRIVVSRAFSPPVADLYGFSLREAIPDFPLPLKPEDEELAVNLQDAIAHVYDFGSYDVRLDYRQPVPPPTLSKSDQQWVDELLASLRGT